MKRVASAAEEAEVERLIAIWLQSGAVSAETADRGRSAALASGGRVDQVLNKLGLVSDEDYAQGWSALTGWPVATSWPSSTLDVAGLSPQFLAHARLVPLRL